LITIAEEAKDQISLVLSLLIYAAVDVFASVRRLSDLEASGLDDSRALSMIGESENTTTLDEGERNFDLSEIFATQPEEGIVQVVDIRTTTSGQIVSIQSGTTTRPEKLEEEGLGTTQPETLAEEGSDIDQNEEGATQLETSKERGMDRHAPLDLRSSLQTWVASLQFLFLRRAS
jgi:hypothetical protein